jgi:magnesium transporter
MEAVDDPADISEVVGRDHRLLWVDVVDPTADDLRCLQEEFDLHHLAMEDATKHGQRPKLERYPTHAFLVTYSAALAEVDVFIGPTWLVTVRERNEEGNTWSPDVARARLARRLNGSELTVGEAVYVILDDIVDGYFEALDYSEELLEDIEELIFADADDLREEVDVQQELFAMRRRLLQFRRRVVPMRDVVNSLLRREVPWIDDAAVVLLQDVFDHVLRVVDTVDAQRELLGNAVDANLALIANRQNQVMKQMTSWGALLIGSTLIAGIYGMNFEHMPELGWRFGYLVALGLMALLTIVGYRGFKRRGWL